MNKTLLIFGILLGSFITLFIVIYYNYTYNYENFYSEEIIDDSDNTNNPSEEIEEVVNSRQNLINKLKEIDKTNPYDDIPIKTGQETIDKEKITDYLLDNAKNTLPVNECYSLFESTDDTTSEVYEHYPLKEYILMQISTDKESNIENAVNKWYDNINYNINSSNHDNDKLWFIASNNIKKIRNNKYAIGALLKDIQLTGPSTMAFANNNNTLNLSKFTVLLTTKINNLDSGENYCLFKMALQKEVDHTTNDTLSSGGHIALILKKMDCNNISLTIYFAEKQFLWKNIPINILKKNIVISLSYLHNEGISILIDNLHKNYIFDNLYEYKLGSTPLIINEHGKLDMILYNFTYYNTKLNHSDINAFINVNTHMLNNKHKINDNYVSRIQELEIEVNSKNEIIASLTNDLTNCRNDVTV